tara:strand:+ start:363 stop:524 length:162 start_codon:yes stop_codon:yes gene_type:complete
MIKEAFIKAMAPISLMVLLLIVGLAPLYVMMGLLARFSSTQFHQTESRPQSLK